MEELQSSNCHMNVLLASPHLCRVPCRYPCRGNDKEQDKDPDKDSPYLCRVTCRYPCREIDKEQDKDRDKDNISKLLRGANHFALYAGDEQGSVPCIYPESLGHIAAQKPFPAP